MLPYPRADAEIVLAVVEDILAQQPSEPQPRGAGQAPLTFGSSSSSRCATPAQTGAPFASSQAAFASASSRVRP